MGLPGMVLSAMATVAGAILYWAITYQGTGFKVSTIGVILMVAGILGFAVSAVVFGVSRRAVGEGRHYLDRQVVDPQGNASSVHEESK
jgi:phosphate/sulfate permease